MSSTLFKEQILLFSCIIYFFILVTTNLLSIFCFLFCTSHCFCLVSSIYFFASAIFSCAVSSMGWALVKFFAAMDFINLLFASLKSTSPIPSYSAFDSLSAPYLSIPSFPLVEDNFLEVICLLLYSSARHWT